jgi:hypothetical protein
MCFSAPVSFAASALLATAGGVALRRARHWNERPFAAIPMLFAAQQCTEGLVWVGLSRTTNWFVDNAVVAVYLLFALAVWPAMIPLSLAVLERAQRTRRILFAASAAGALFGAFLFIRSLHHGAYGCVVANHLYYALHLRNPTRPLLSVAYVSLTLGPFALCTRRDLRWFGAAFAVAYGASFIVMRTQLVSVWCFAAACLSVGVVALVGRSGPRTIHGACRA